MRTDKTAKFDCIKKSVIDISKNYIDNGTAGQTVVVAQQSAYETLHSLFAAWSVGCTVVLVNADLAESEQHTVLRATGAVAWIGTSAPTVQEQLAMNRAATARHTKTAKDSSQPSLILMTSGTAGDPKGVHLTLDALAQRVRLNLKFIPPGGLDNTLCVLPAFFGHGLIGNCLTPLAAGATLHLLDRPTMPELTKMGTVLDEHAITFMSSVPSFWKVVTKVAKPPQTQSLKRVHVGSAPLNQSDAQTVADWTGTRAIFNLYGMTEAANWISAGAALPQTASNTTSNSASDSETATDGYVGKPWGGEFAVLTPEGAVSKQGKGEVLLKTPSLMTGYWNQPQKTQEAFHEGWFKTGDIGELSSDGALRLVGRTKWEINRAGMKIQAEEVDALLERHPAVLEACAFGIPDAISGEVVAAAIKMDTEAEESPEAIRQWCRNQARKDVVPVWLEVLQDLPKNDRGKLDRTTTKDEALQAHAARA
ncbi:MAG: class I adenylate-forming enzyme family protein [Pseudomonadota bacterium]